jgi:hypothetical protein
MTAFKIYMHGLYPLAYPTQKQLDAMAGAGRAYIAPDFKETFYHGLVLLAAEL